MRHTAFHHAQLVQEQTQQRIATDLDEMQSTILAAFEKREKEDKENIPPNEQALAMSNNTQTQLMQALTKLTAKVDQLECKIASNPAQPKTDRTKDPEYMIPFWKKAANKRKYCWTCGSCWHNGAEHRGAKDEGHKDEATFDNRMGGSEKGIAKRFL